MLVVSRKVNEEIIIGGDIRVTVIRVEGSRVRLGISAPREVSIRRAELTAHHNEDSLMLAGSHYES
jgi:carbon storage regulator CsrA